MKQLLFAATLLFFLFNGQAQDYINVSKPKLEAILKNKYPVKGKKSPVIVSRDSIRVELSGPTEATTTYIYGFDEKGLCLSESIFASCDSCLSGLLQQVLDKKNFEWKKINENQYISRFDGHLLIEISPQENIRSFSVLRVDWTREIYDLLLKE